MITDKKRNEYSKQYHCRLLNGEAEQLGEILSDKKITFVEFLRQAIKNEVTK